MPGTPILDALEARIAERGGDDHVFERMASGERLKDIAADLGVSRPMMYRWRSHLPHKESRMVKWKEALRASAEAMADESLEVLDELADTPASELTPALVNLAKERSVGRRWIAGMRNPEEYGEKQTAGVVLNIGALHLDALRSVGSRPALPAQEAEVLAIEAGDE